MFTGIIEEVGSVQELWPVDQGARIAVSCRRVWNKLEIGESVDVNGVCLTVVETGAGRFTADISEESLSRSTLGGLKRGAPVNLERALTLESRLGGHLVQGHVDGVGAVKAIKSAGESRTYTFSCPADLKEYLVEKGSIAVDGISLTISTMGEGEFGVAAIPHTIRQTNLKGLRVGDTVNLETDIIAKYVRSYLAKGLSPRESAGEGDSGFYNKLLEGGFA
jgi:riboflavin synthase